MHTSPHQEVSPQFSKAIRSWTETGNNAERPTPSCSITGWLAIPPSVNSSPRSAEQSLLNSRTNICVCPDEKDRGEVQTRWNVLHPIGAIDRKHIVMKKPKKSSSDYYNYKGFFSLILLALVDAEYRLLWIDYGSSGVYSDVQIFNRSNLNHYFCLFMRKVFKIFTAYGSISASTQVQLINNIKMQLNCKTIFCQYLSKYINLYRVLHH